MKESKSEKCLIGPGFCLGCFGMEFVSNGSRKDGRKIFKCSCCGRQSVSTWPDQVVRQLLDRRSREIAKILLTQGVAVNTVAAATGIPKRTLSAYRLQL